MDIWRQIFAEKFRIQSLYLHGQGEEMGFPNVDKCGQGEDNRYGWPLIPILNVSDEIFEKHFMWICALQEHLKTFVCINF